MTRVAAVDCGTNSTRLLVAEAGSPLATVEREMRVTRLGAGVDRTGHLDDAALARTVDVIAGYHERALALGAQRMRIAATSAIRDAVDRHRFLDAVGERTGVAAEVLTGDAEAATAFAGATRSVDGAPPYLVLDIGGGSTELITGTEGPEALASHQIGCVRLTERCLAGDPPTEQELAGARAVAREELGAAIARTQAATARTVIGVAGTVTTLAALHLGLPFYDAGRIHGTRLPRAAVDELTDALARQPAAARAELGPMAPGREDVIVGGAIVLREAMALLEGDEVLVSEADILDGLALALLDAAGRDQVG